MHYLNFKQTTYLMHYLKFQFIVMFIAIYQCIANFFTEKPRLFLTLHQNHFRVCRYVYSFELYASLVLKFKLL